MGLLYVPVARNHQLELLSLSGPSCLYQAMLMWVGKGRGILVHVSGTLFLFSGFRHKGYRPLHHHAVHRPHKLKNFFQLLCDLPSKGFTARLGHSWVGWTGSHSAKFSVWCWWDKECCNPLHCYSAPWPSLNVCQPPRPNYCLCCPLGPE